DETEFIRLRAALVGFGKRAAERAMADNFRNPDDTPTIVAIAGKRTKIPNRFEHGAEQAVARPRIRGEPDDHIEPAYILNYERRCNADCTDLLLPPAPSTTTSLSAWTGNGSMIVVNLRK